MSQCVLCFSELPLNHVRWTCINTACAGEKRPDGILQSYLGREVSTGFSVEARKPVDHKGAWRPAQQACTTCHEQMASACPICHHAIPTASREADVITIAFTGARNSGKSVAIGAASFFLEKLVEQLDSALLLDGRFSESHIDEYVKVLLSGEAMGATPAGVARSLVFDLGKVKGKQRFLALRDVAGEDLQNSDTTANLSFVGKADMVVFLFDPLAVPAIAHALEDQIPAQEHVGAPPEQVLQNVLRAIGPGTPKLAICIAKMDALQLLANRPVPIGQVFGNMGSALVRERGVSPTYDETSGALLSEEVRSLLSMLDGTALVNMVEQASAQRQIQVRYFAVSALGFATNANDLDPHGIRPFRVLDPLQWLLAEDGVLATV